MTLRMPFRHVSTFITVLSVTVFGLNLSFGEPNSGGAGLFKKKTRAAAEAQKPPVEPLYTARDRTPGPGISPDSSILSEVEATIIAEKNQRENPPPALAIFPQLDLDRPRLSETDERVERLVDGIYAAYEAKVRQLSAADLQLTSVGGLSAVPSNFSASWANVTRRIWDGESALKQNLDQVYANALVHSNSVKVFSDIPLIRQTAIQEAEGDFDWRLFTQGQYQHGDTPTTSTLDGIPTPPGTIGRLIERRYQLDYGLRKRIDTGAEISISHRVGSFKSNSDFVNPNPQASSEMVISVTQPLMRGAGYHYNRARLKVAHLDADMATAEYLRQLESHLLEVNRAYWQVYLARAAFLQRKDLVDQTAGIVGKLRDRAEVDPEATQSELLRASAALSSRRATLIRSEMSIKNAEERLRTLVNDPDFAMGTGGEFVPLTRPVLAPPASGVRATALASLYHRPEVVQAFAQVRAAGIRRDVQENELQPQLDLFAETRHNGLGADRQLADPLDNMFGEGTGWTVGFSFEQSLERNTQKARFMRRKYELRQASNQLRSVLDTVLLESVVAYRELLTAYRDMQGRYQAAVASREEVQNLRDRLDLDADDNTTVGYQLQLVLDALDRNQAAEENFLVSIVSYNVAFANVERAKGTLLQYNDVDIDRIRMENEYRHWAAMEAIVASLEEYPGAGMIEGSVIRMEPRRQGADWDRHRAALEALKNQ